jgi:hypothetical protein
VVGEGRAASIKASIFQCSAFSHRAPRPIVSQGKSDNLDGKQALARRRTTPRIMAGSATIWLDGHHMAYPKGLQLPATMLGRKRA